MSETIDADQVRQIARLSRIELTDEQVVTFGKQLAGVLEHFNKLAELDTENVQPMAHAVELHNVLAEDTPGESISPEQALQNAPQRDGDFYKVPKVIGDSA